MAIPCMKNYHIKNLKWSNDLTLDKIQTGIYELDISIPKELHYKFKNYPLASEIKSIPENNLFK